MSPETESQIVALLKTYNTAVMESASASEDARQARQTARQIFDQKSFTVIAPALEAFGKVIRDQGGYDFEVENDRSSSAIENEVRLYLSIPKGVERGWRPVLRFGLDQKSNDIRVRTSVPRGGRKPSVDLGTIPLNDELPEKIEAITRSFLATVLHMNTPTLER